MYTEMALAARKLALTLAVAGVATLGSVALAPAASATGLAPATTTTGPVLLEGSDRILVGVGGGPDQFLLMEPGRKPIFFCDAAAPHRRHNVCMRLDGARGD